MSDALGFRRKVGVIVPSTNTIAQPELDAIRPRGVTNHVSRIPIRDRLIKNDDDFLKLISEIRGGTMDAVDVAMTCAPDALILAASAESFWDGTEGGRRLEEHIEEQAGVSIVIPSEACRAALQKFGSVKRLGVITPYMPVGDQQVRKFFTECGYEIVTLKALRCQSPVRSHRSARPAARRHRRARRPSHRGDRPGRIQSGGGAHRRHRRALARHARHRREHRDLLAGAAPKRHR